MIYYVIKPKISTKLYLPVAYITILIINVMCVTSNQYSNVVV